MVQDQVVEELLNGAVGTVMLGPAQEGKCGADREKPPVPSRSTGQISPGKSPPPERRPSQRQALDHEQEKAPECREQVEVAAFDQGEFLRLRGGG